MKKMPNMPATLAIWIRLAPVTLRERKMPSGTSGLAAVISRTTNSPSSTSEAAPNQCVPGPLQPSVAAGPTIA